MPTNYTFWFLITVVIVLLYLALRKGKESGNGFKITGSKVLDSFTTDFTALAASGRMDPVIGREEEITRLTQVMSRREKNNAILIGPPGVGKTAIVEGLAQLMIKGEVPDNLKNDRLLSLDMAGLMAGTKYRGEFEQRAKKIVDEISASNRGVILFIDEVHTIIESRGTEGAVNFSDILKPALARGDLQMIGATTDAEYKKYIQSDPSLERRFQPIEVREPTVEETVRILQKVKDRYRDFHQVEFTDSALDLAVKLSQKYITDRRLPDKALDIMDECGAMVKVSHVHSDVPIILYAAAAQKYPEAAKLWEMIQKFDRIAFGKKNSAAARELKKAEDDLAKMGVLVVDSEDIKTVVEGWKN